jgi:hypothetical protein
LPALDVVLDLLYCVASKAFSWFDGVLVHPILDLPARLDYSLQRFSHLRVGSSAFPGVKKDNIQAPSGATLCLGCLLKVHCLGFGGAMG